VAHITEAKKKSWSTPIIRKLTGTEADEARKLLTKQLQRADN
jgi:hypothetical protein